MNQTFVNRVKNVLPVCTELFVTNYLNSKIYEGKRKLKIVYSDFCTENEKQYLLYNEKLNYTWQHIFYMINKSLVHSVSIH
jgi:hypothetical protein